MDGIRLFPTPFPSETLHSMVSRYHRLIGGLSIRRTLCELFGTYTRTLGSDFPCCLLYFESRTGLTGLADSHSLLPLFRPFIGPEKYLTACHLMSGSSGIGLKLALGVTAAGFERHRTLRMCAECIQNDLTSVGVAYWHLIHQVCGISVCPIHGCTLSRVVESALDKFHDSLCLPLDERVHQRTVDYSLTVHQAGRMFNLARLIQWGFSNPDLVSLLLERGFLDFRLEEMAFSKFGRLVLCELRRFLVASLGTYPRNFEFHRLGGQCAECPDWPISLIRKRNRAHHPLYYFCLLELLKVTCGDCVSFLQGGRSYQHPTRCVYPVTVGLLVLDQELMARRTSFSSQAQKVGSRNASDYMWLYRHDRIWLSEYCSNHRVESVKMVREDLVKRDTALAARIDEAATVILGSPGKPIRLTVASLARQLGVSEGVFDRRGHYPRCRATLDRWIEPKHAFQLRKVAWAAAELAQSGSGIGKSNLLRKAGISVCVLSAEELAKLLE